ncbi:hypothetical protein EP7_003398 [Isosphaeraceae bacterium EP7]
MPRRFCGIDEAGYGPNLGPMVMASVEAIIDDENPASDGFDLWSLLPQAVSRARGPAACLWVDDSKRVYKPGGGLSRLDDALGSLMSTLAIPAPRTLGEVASSLEVSEDQAELEPWAEGVPQAWPRPSERPGPSRLVDLRGKHWRLTSIRAVMVGPRRFNEGLSRHGSKAGVHFEAFSSLLEQCWTRAGDGIPTSIRGDKHGGRHYYAAPVAAALPDAGIEIEVESPALSRYRLGGQGRQVSLGFEPRADSGDGLVALASLIAKGLREHWMAMFNGYWAGRIPGLRPTAGYPLDAARFRAQIESTAFDRGLCPDIWWRHR